MKLTEIKHINSMDSALNKIDEEVFFLWEAVNWSPKMHAHMHGDGKRRTDRDSLFLDTMKNAETPMGYASTKAQPYLHVASANPGGKRKGPYYPSIIVNNIPGLSDVLKNAGMNENMYTLDFNKHDKVQDPRKAAYFAQKFIDKVLNNPSEASNELKHYFHLKNTSQIADKYNPDNSDEDSIGANRRSHSFRNPEQVIDHYMKAFAKRLSSEQRVKLKKSGAARKAREKAERTFIQPGGGFAHGTDPKQIKNMIRNILVPAL